MIHQNHIYWFCFFFRAVSTIFSVFAVFAILALMAMGCIGCTGCIDCFGCIGHNNVIGCIGCNFLFGCIGCISCFDCNGSIGFIFCIDCLGCIGCFGCIFLRKISKRQHKVCRKSWERLQKVFRKSSKDLQKLLDSPHKVLRMSVTATLTPSRSRWHRHGHADTKLEEGLRLCLSTALHCTLLNFTLLHITAMLSRVFQAGTAEKCVTFLKRMKFLPISRFHKVQ